MRYNKPYYLPSYTTITPFYDDFKNLTNVWYKVKYWIDRNRYTPRLVNGQNPRLENIYDCYGNDVFARTVFDHSKYKLLAEEKEDKGLYFEITETYGFAPEDVFYKYSTASVQFAGHTNTGGSLVDSTQVTFSLDATGTRVNCGGYGYKGDEVYFKRPERTTSGTTYYAATSSIVTMVEDGIAPNPSFTNDYNGAQYTTRAILNEQTRDTLTLYLFKRTTQPRTDTVLITTETQYYLTRPDIVPRTKLVDTLGNEVWDSTGATVQNLYNGKYCIEDSAIAEEFGLWRRDIKTTDYPINRF